jgi:hypothetical protein
MTRRGAYKNYCRRTLNAKEQFMNKKLFLVFVGIMLIIGLVLAGCEKANPEKDFRREANDRGGVTITGYVGQSETVIIPSRMDGKPVSDIGESAFQECTGLTSVSIPRSVTSIGDLAFVGCSGLTSVTFGSGSNIASGNFGAIAFPEGSARNGDGLKKAYSTGGAGTYTRDPDGTTWRKKG